MRKGDCTKVFVTGGSGYIASWLIKKLLERGYYVHATLRSLDEKSKVGLLESLPYADTRLELFQAEIYNPGTEFERAIEGCHYVFHVATPILHNTQSSHKYKDITEAAIAGVKTIADSCIRSKTVKRLIYTTSLVSSSPLKEDGTGYKSSLDESCWTPLNYPCMYSNDPLMAYTKSKTLSERELLRYNEIENSKLEVVSLCCALVGGDTLLSYLPTSIATMISQLTGDLSSHNCLRFLQELFGSIPLVHIEDICEAHIFCMENESMRGRFLCGAVDPTMQEMEIYYQKNFPQLINLPKELFRGPDRKSACNFTKLVEYDMKKILDGSVDCGVRLGATSSVRLINHPF